MEYSDLPYASFSQRLIALVVDMVIFILGVTLLSVLLQLIGLRLLPDMGGMSMSDFIDYYQNNSGSLRAYNMTLTALNILYYAHFESSIKQATPGKQMMKIIVTDKSGMRLNLWQAIIRNTGKIISQMILFIGYFMCLFTKKKQTLHDIIADTLVIRRVATPQILAV